MQQFNDHDHDESNRYSQGNRSEEPYFDRVVHQDQQHQQHLAHYHYPQQQQPQLQQQSHPHEHVNVDHHQHISNDMQFVPGNFFESLGYHQGYEDSTNQFQHHQYHHPLQQHQLPQPQQEQQQQQQYFPQHVGYSTTMVPHDNVSILDTKPPPAKLEMYHHHRGDTDWLIERQTPIELFQLRPWDVICQRGRDAFDHVGNRRLRLLVATNLVKYCEGTRKQKITIVQNVTQMIREANGRFVQKTKTVQGGKKKSESDTEANKKKGGRQEEQWVELPSMQARDKVGHVFRDYLRQQKKRKNSTYATSSELGSNSQSASIDSPPSDTDTGGAGDDAKLDATKSKTEEEQDDDSKPKTKKRTRRSSEWIERKDVIETQDTILRGMHIYHPGDDEDLMRRLILPEITIPERPSVSKQDVSDNRYT